MLFLVEDGGDEDEDVGADVGAKSDLGVGVDVNVDGVEDEVFVVFLGCFLGLFALLSSDNDTARVPLLLPLGEPVGPRSPRSLRLPFAFQLIWIERREPSYCHERVVSPS